MQRSHEPFASGNRSYVVKSRELCGKMKRELVERRNR